MWHRHTNNHPGKIGILEKYYYTLEGYFYLRQESWIDNYYRPLQERYEAFLKRNNASELARKVVEQHQDEMDLYLKYREHFSYGFYIARKQ